MVLFNSGKLPFKRLVSLRNLDGLKQIVVSDDRVKIGATVTFTQIRRHPLLQSEFPLLCQAAAWTGGVANQNQGTIGGNLANASPAADSAPPLLVHDAEIHLVSAVGERMVPYSEFHLGYKKLAMRSDELISFISFPRRDKAWRVFGRKTGTRKAQAISKVSFAAAVQVNGRKLATARLAFGSVAPIPLRCCATEQFLTQTVLTPASIIKARALLKSEISPIDDIRSTADYRLSVAQNVLTAFLEGLL